MYLKFDDWIRDMCFKYHNSFISVLVNHIREKFLKAAQNDHATFAKVLEDAQIRKKTLTIVFDVLQEEKIT